MSRLEISHGPYHGMRIALAEPAIGPIMAGLDGHWAQTRRRREMVLGGAVRNAAPDIGGVKDAVCVSLFG